jgi:UDP-N-acetylmuramyl pentapeptide phosphotransferase/UDP-N-acetylglucosamine-1-phosphate transferase/glycosyltransferase involved in cell wall biosynthesis
MSLLAFVTCLAAGLLAVLFTPVVINLAYALKAVDRPDPRKVHRAPTPRLGGVAIAAAMFLSLIPALVMGKIANPEIAAGSSLASVLICAAAVFLTGFLDDLMCLPSKLKLIVLLVAALFVCNAGFRIESIDLGGGHVFELGKMQWVVSLLWIVSITVSINFIDGLDGLAAGISVMTCAVIAIAATHYHQQDVLLISMALLGALIGFLCFNFNPARIFMGDGGSMYVGFMIGCTSLVCGARVHSPTVLALPALALGVPLMDLLFTMIRRGVIQRRSLFSAERGHIHHRLLDRGLHHKQVVIVLYVATVICASLGLLLLLTPGRAAMVETGLAILSLLILFRFAGSVKFVDTARAVLRNRAIRGQTSEYRRRFEEMQLRFRIVKDFDGWWQEVCTAAEKFDFVSLTLPVADRAGRERMLRFGQTVTAKDAEEAMVASVPIRQRRLGAPLQAEVHVGKVGSLESAGTRLSLFARLMEEHSLADLEYSCIQKKEARVPALPDIAPAQSKIAEDSSCGPACGHAACQKAGTCAERRPTLDSAIVLLESDQTASEGSHAIERIEAVASSPDASVSRSATVGETLVVSASQDPSLEGDFAMPNRKPKVAVVHDFLYCYAGAERVLEQILDLYPQADIFSLFDFLDKSERGFIQDKPVKSTFIQKLPLARKKHRHYLPLMPLAIEQLDVAGYDIVISSSYLAAKGIITSPNQLHICYCHSPARYAWDLQHQYLKQSGLTTGIKSIIVRAILHYIRAWDIRTSNGVDLFVSNSDFVGRRIEKIYRRQATTIYPPVDTEAFSVEMQKEEFYLTTSRLVPYKKVDLIVEAFNRMPSKRLIVVGEGPDFEKIKARAGANIRMVGHQPFETLREYMQRAKAFVFTAEEDFGIVPVEAQSCGTPVIAFGQGGVTESVIPGVTGIFFPEQTPESLIAAVKQFEAVPHWDPIAIRRNADRFSIARFRKEFSELVDDAWGPFKAARDRRVPVFEERFPSPQLAEIPAAEKHDKAARNGEANGKANGDTNGKSNGDANGKTHSDTKATIHLKS